MGTYTKSVLECDAANSVWLEELGHRPAAHLRVGRCPGWRVLGRREIRDARCGLDVNVWDCHFAFWMSYIEVGLVSMVRDRNTASSTLYKYSNLGCRPT